MRSLRRRPLLNKLIRAPIRGLFALLRRSPPPDWVWRRVSFSGNLDVAFDGGRGFKLVGRTDDWASTSVYWLGLAEAEPDALFFRNLAAAANLVFDVGANVGLYTLLAASAASKPHVVALEPAYRPYERLLTNLMESDLGNVTTINAAAGDFDGCARMFHPPVDGIPVTGSLDELFLTEYGAGVSSGLVPVIRLDSIVQVLHAHADLVKIDTEGTEVEVLAGMHDLLGGWSPDIFCEVLERTGTANELMRLLQPYGYNYYHVIDGRPEPCAEVRGSEIHRNYLFTQRAESEVIGLLQ